MDSAQQSAVKTNIFSFLGKFPLLKILISLALVIVLLLLGWLLWYYGYLGEFGKVAAVVSGKKIYKSEFDRRVEVMTYIHTNITHDQDRLKNVKKNELDSLIRVALMEQSLSKLGVSVTSKEIEDALAVQVNKYGGIDSYKNLLEKQYHSNLDDSRYSIKAELLQKKIEQRLTQKELLGIWLKRPIPGDAPEKATPEQKAADKKVLEKANMILAKVRKGENFSILAEAYSEDMETAEAGGDIGFYNPTISEPKDISQFKRLFPSHHVLTEAFNELGKGEAKVFEYPSGYSIIKVTDIKEGIGAGSYDDWYKKAVSDSAIIKFVKID